MKFSPERKEKLSEGKEEDRGSVDGKNAIQATAPNKKQARILPGLQIFGTDSGLVMLLPSL